MTKEELIAFLKENLKIELDHDRSYNGYESTHTISVYLMLDGDVISKSDTYFYENE